jgi:hypothetical protein
MCACEGACTSAGSLCEDVPACDEALACAAVLDAPGVGTIDFVLSLRLYATNLCRFHH